MGQKYLLDTNVILISHDVKDFQKIEELQFLDSYFM